MPVAADLQPLLDAMVEARSTPIFEASPEDRRALFDEMFGPGGGGDGFGDRPCHLRWRRG